MDRLRSQPNARRRRISTRHILAILLSAAAGVTAAHALDGLVNPFFDTGSSGWSTVDGSLSWSSAFDVDGCPGSGSALVSTPQFVNNDWTITLVSTGSCLPTVPGVSPIYVLHVLPAASIQHTDIALLGYTDETCTAGQTELPIAGYGPLSSVWIRLQFGLALDASIHSIRALVRTRDGSNTDYSYYFDSIYLGFADPVFLDDFEDGSTCRWSAVVPTLIATN